MRSIQTSTLSVPRLAIRRRNRLSIAAGVLLLAGGVIEVIPLITGNSIPAPLLLNVAETAADRSVSLAVWRDSTIIESTSRGTGAAEFLPEPVRASMDESPWPATAARNDADGMRWFNGRPIRPARTISVLVTAYSPDARSCGDSADGITASGYSVWTNGMKLVAADTSVLPFGTLLTIPGYDGGQPVPVLDRGGKIKGQRLDVLFPTHEAAIQWGARQLDVIVWDYADGQPNDFRENHR